MTLRHGLVLLSDEDADAPDLPAVATVSKDDAWDHGAYNIGLADCQRGALWVDRPYFTGNPSVDWMVAKCDRVTDAGGYAQLGNEQNLTDVEHWIGGPAAWDDFYWAVFDRVKAPERLLAMPPSPGLPGWEEWVTPVGGGPHAVHAYGDLGLMQSTVRWYLANTSGDLFVTECNFGAGNEVSVDRWADDHLVPFLDWLATQPRVRFCSYFAWKWRGAPPMPTNVDAAGTRVETVLRAWTPKEPPVADITLSVPTTVAMASPENYAKGPRARTLGVVVHTTRGGAGSLEQEYQGTVGWFQNPAAQVSAHLVVGPAAVARCVHDVDVGWHAREANQTHLGIEIAQPAISTPITDFQYRAAAEACRKWAAVYKFPLARVMTITAAGLVGHEDSEPGKRDGKSDPGPVFDWPKFLALCKGGTMPDTVDQLQEQAWALGDQLMKLGPRYDALGYPHRAAYVGKQGDAVKEWVNTASKGQK